MLAFNTQSVVDLKVDHLVFELLPLYRVERLVTAYIEPLAVGS
jgi:hypothetical protein